MLAVAILALQLLPSRLEGVLNTPLLKGATVGAYVEKLDGSVLFDRNSDRRLVPASNEKLFTAAFALSQLGTDYHPVTRFWKLKDRIVVETSGDPMLTYGDLKHAVDVLKITSKLPVYVKEPYRIGYPPQWEYGDLPNKYAAPVTGFTVDRGSFELWADSTQVFFKPANYGTKAVHYKSGSTRRSRYSPFNKIAKVWGPLPPEPKLIDTLSIAEPDVAAASVLGEGFHETKDVPATPPDLVLEGPMLPVIVKECLVHSDNNLAENLLLLGALKQGSLGEDPYVAACERERDFVSKTVGVDETEFHPDDGSGLSRHNWVTSRSIASLLQWASKQPTFDLWKQSLASPGNGTLKTRLKDSTFVGKTGTMDGVVALSGYVKNKEGLDLIVSLIVNYHHGSHTRIREVLDDFVRNIEGSTLSGTVLEGSIQRESLNAHPSLGTVRANWLH